jgi:hypothetical protein
MLKIESENDMFIVYDEGDVVRYIFETEEDAVWFMQHEAKLELERLNILFNKSIEIVTHET